MTYDITYQRRGDAFIGRVARTVKTERAARSYCRKIENFPADTIAFAIIREDGVIVHDSHRDGINA